MFPNSPREIMARVRTYYDTKSATATAQKFPAEPPIHRVWEAARYGATRIDTFDQKMKVKFPTWQKAADFHDRINATGATQDIVLYAVPISLPAPRTYEEYLSDMSARTSRRANTVDNFPTPAAIKSVHSRHLCFPRFLF